MDENEIEGTKGFIGRLRLRVTRHPGGLGVLAIGPTVHVALALKPDPLLSCAPVICFHPAPRERPRVLP